MRGTKTAVRWLAGALVMATVAASCSSDSEDAATSSVTVTTVTAPSTTATTTATTDAATDPTDSAPVTDDTTATSETATTDTEPTDGTPELAPLSEPDAATTAEISAALKPTVFGCDPLDNRACLLPFPSNAYTVDDPATDTGLRVSFPLGGAAGANAQGVAINLAEWNRNDGFSPDSSLLTVIPGIDAVKSNLPPWTDLQQSLADDAPVVIIDSDTGERVPLWAELDAKAVADADRSLVIHPAVSLPEGHHFAVAIRNVKDATGAVIEAGPVFRVYRDRIAYESLETRRQVMEETLAALGAAGIARDDLFLAWDFTVASQRNLSERLLSIRDQALTALGDVAPAFTVTSMAPGTDDSDIAMQIAGTYTVPNFLTGDGSPGHGFNYAATEGEGNENPDALPVQNGTVEVGFLCNVSNATVAATEPAHLVQYGHGLLGSNDEINAGNVRAFANESNVVFCATKWAGLSEDDIGNAAATLGEISNFPTVADRMQQGVLNQIFLGRLMSRPGGLSSLPELTRADGSSMLDTAHLDYDGNSQGGIMGIMLAAVSPDIERAVVGVSGINYSLLLPRSVDFATYEAIFKPAYPNDLDRMIDIGLLQMLWDRGEGGGYVQHVTSNPYEGTPAKTVLMDIAFGDWQVSELGAMVAARTMGLPIQRPVAAAGRSEEVYPGWGLETLTYPSNGGGIIVWDSGADPIPFDAVPPFTGFDPHEHPRRDPDVRAQKAAFLFDDTLIDVCAGAACTADRND